RQPAQERVEPDARAEHLPGDDVVRHGLYAHAPERELGLDPDLVRVDVDRGLVVVEQRPVAEPRVVQAAYARARRRALLAPLDEVHEARPVARLVPVRAPQPEVIVEAEPQ